LVLATVAAGCDSPGSESSGAGPQTTSVDDAGSQPPDAEMEGPAESPASAVDEPATSATSSADATATSLGEQAGAASSAAAGLAGFFDAARALDERIRAAAELFNAGYDPEAGTVGGEAVDVIEALDATPVGRLVPGGLPVELEAAVLRVFAHLDSRVSALRHGMEIAVASGDPLHCFGLGGESAARFAADLRTAEELASAAPGSVSAPGSPESGMAAVRVAYIHGANWCCDSCGGYVYDTPLGVDWGGRVLAPGQIDAPFEAVYNGEYWQVTFPQAGAGIPADLPAFRPDGLGAASFGDPPELVVALVEALLGFAATDDTGWIPAEQVAPVCPGPTVRIVEFDNLGLLFADDGYFAPSGTEQFVEYWYYGNPPLIATGPPDGINVGSTIEDLLAVYPEAEIVPESDRLGPTFSVGAGGEQLWGQLSGVATNDEIISIFGGVGCGD
jgi:hypothetical protein